ncbi:MAG: hypothetical protein C0598_02780 [Marinilabiliales bacterium]|nr:MAG: hypothetical protein C0598_02780 [Marinilabiliales bacterium]
MMNNNKSEYLDTLAKFIASFKSKKLDENLLKHAAITVADTYGTAFSGIKTKAFKTAFENTDLLFGKGAFEVWGTEKKLSLLGSVFYNSLSISSTDFDDGHRKAVGHPASAVTAIAISMGLEKKLKITEVLKSVVLGYEIATRFSLARKPENINSYSSGRWAAFGAAATAAYILEFDREQIINALSNAFVLSPHMLGGSSDVSTGAMSKEGVAWAVQSGLQSAILAKSGFSGPFLFIEESDEFDPLKLTDGLGDSFFISSNYFKPYACCRWLHPAINACSNLVVENNINIEEIVKIKVSTFSRIKDLISEKYPTNVIMAQFHLPYALSVMMLYNQCIPEYFNDDYLKNAEIRNLINKMEIISNDKYDNIFPSKLASSIEIDTASQKYFKEKLSAPWDFGDHPSMDDLQRKFNLQTNEFKHIPWDWFFNF